MTIIADYTELVVEAAHISGVSDVGQRAGFFVGQAEKLIERELKINIAPLETHTTNPMLETNPELYLQAVLFQIYVGNDEVQKAATTRSYLTTLIDEQETADMHQRWTDQPYHLPGDPP